MKNILTLTFIRPTYLGNVVGQNLLRIGIGALIAAFAAAAFYQNAKAQTTKPTDGATPLGLQAGTPAGAYSLSGFDNVNLYNGSLSFALPLLRLADAVARATRSCCRLSVSGWLRKTSLENTRGIFQLTKDPRKSSRAMGRE